MPLDPATRARVVDEAKRRGIDPAVALAAAEKVAPTAAPVEDDRRSATGRIPDDELTCGDYQVKHGGAAAAPATTDSPAGGA